MEPALDAPRAVPGAPLAVRVAFVGERGRAWLGDWVEAIGSPPGGGAPAGFDALVVDANPNGVDRAEVERLVEAARASGARVVGLGDGGDAAQPVWVGLEDLAVGTGPDREAGDEGAVPTTAGVRPVDPRVFNPLGFRHTDVAGFAAVLDAGAAAHGAAEGLRLLGRAAAAEPVALYSPRGVLSSKPPAGVLTSAPPAGGPPALCAALKERLGVLDHPSFHASEAERAAALVRLCASGVPVVCAGLSPRLRAMLGVELAGALSRLALEDLLDLDLRERASVCLRRAALRNHSLDARWRALADAAGLSLPERPKVSVILSTRREEWLSFGLAQVARQNYAPRELVVCLHGDDFSDGVEERVRAEVSGPLEIVHVASELTLGDALNQGVEVASGELVTKMDDDDYYSVDHLWDLVLASEYSGAELVGKAAEFVYLEDVDLTLRRFMGDTEGTANPRLAGGGMMARRGPLRELGGWPAQSRGEDTALIKTFRQSRHRIHRTHGYGYILNRHGRDHTWNTFVDYFLVQSEREWRGLRFDETGID